MIVMKFGGSSVESAAAIERVASIVKGRLARKPVVVVSAMGKTTNRLLRHRQCSDVNGTPRRRRLQRTARFHLEARAKLAPRGAAGDREHLDEHFQELAELVKGSRRTRRADAALGGCDLELTASGCRARSWRAFRKHGMDAVTRGFAGNVIVTDARHTQAAPQYCPKHTSAWREDSAACAPAPW